MKMGFKSSPSFVQKNVCYQVPVGHILCVFVLSIRKLNSLFHSLNIYTLSGRTDSALVCHSEGRTIEALSVQ